MKVTLIHCNPFLHRLSLYEYARDILQLATTRGFQFTNVLTIAKTELIACVIFSVSQPVRFHPHWPQWWLKKWVVTRNIPGSPAPLSTGFVMVIGCWTRKALARCLHAAEYMGTKWKPSTMRLVLPRIALWSTMDTKYRWWLSSQVMWWRF